MGGRAERRAGVSQISVLVILTLKSMGSFKKYILSAIFKKKLFQGFLILLKHFLLHHSLFFFLAHFSKRSHFKAILNCVPCVLLLLLYSSKAGEMEALYVLFAFGTDR